MDKFVPEEIKNCEVLQSSDFIRYVDDGLYVFTNGEILIVEAEKKVENTTFVDYTKLDLKDRINFKNDDNFDSIFDETPDLGSFKEFNICGKCVE